MDERRKSAYAYIAKQLFAAAEALHEAADTIDLEGIAADIGELRREAERLTIKAQRFQKAAREPQA